MKYFDAAYIAKCYLNEPGAARVRGLACRAPGLCSADFGDALHLACAREYGFTEIHTNDRHMLAAAPEFDITGVDVIA